MHPSTRLPSSAGKILCIKSEYIIKEVPNAEKISETNFENLLNHHNSVILFMSPNDLTEFENKYIEKYKKNND